VIRDLLARCGTAVLLAVVAIMSLHASVILTFEPVTVTAGTSNDAFDITLTNRDASAIVIGGFSFGLTPENAGVDFLDATTSTGLPYIFAGDSLFGPDITVSVSGQSIEVSDVFDTPGGGVTILPGTSVGLGHVVFNAAPGSSTVVTPIDFAAYPFTSLSDAMGNDVAFTDVGGAVTIVPAVVATPEPPGFGLCGAIVLLLVARRRRRSGMLRADMPGRAELFG